MLKQLLPHVERHLATGGRLAAVTRHILGLYHGERRGRLFRRHLSEAATRPGAGLAVLEAALALVEVSERLAPAAE